MDRSLEEYLEQIEHRLKPLCASERADIVKEIQSEMEELLQKGASPEQVLERLGGARELAGAYLGENIAKNERFSWKKLRTVLAFYSFAGMGGLFVLPVLSVLSVGLMVSGAIAPAAGLIKLLGHLMGREVPFVVFQIGTYTAPPALVFPLSVGMGVLLFIAGRGLWKLLIRFIQKLGKDREKMRAA